MGRRITLDDWAVQILVEEVKVLFEDADGLVSYMDAEISRLEEKLGEEVNPLLPDPEAEKESVRVRLNAARTYRALKHEDAAKYKKLLDQLS